MVSKVRKRQSKRWNRNISFNSDIEESNGEIPPPNRTREGENVLDNVLPGNEIQGMIESAVVRALSSYGVNTDNQSKQLETAQSNSKANKNGDNANNGQSCNSDQYHNRSRDGNCADSSNLIGRPAANYHSFLKGFFGRIIRKLTTDWHHRFWVSCSGT